MTGHTVRGHPAGLDRLRTMPSCDIRVHPAHPAKHATATRKYNPNLCSLTGTPDETTCRDRFLTSVKCGRQK